MYQLYYLQGSCALATHAVLCQIGQPYEAIRVTHAEIKQPAFLKLNPRGNVPLLLDDGFPIREQTAILTYLCDKHGFMGWSTENGTQARAQCLQWLGYCSATLHPAYSAAFGTRAFDSDNTKHDVLAMAQKRIQSCWDELNQVLASQTYLGGDEPGPADIFMTVIANWNNKVGFHLSLGPNVMTAIDGVLALPAFQQAMSEQDVKYSLAA